MTWRVAPFVRRLGAFLIDLVTVVLWVALAMVVLALVLVVRGLMRPNPLAPPNAVDNFFMGLISYGGLAAAALAVAVYFVVAWRHDGTIGMRILRLKVVRVSDGGQISVATACIRFVAALASLGPLGLGLLWASWDGRSQGWHDQIARTAVWQRVS